MAHSHMRFAVETLRRRVESLDGGRASAIVAASAPRAERQGLRPLRVEGAVAELAQVIGTQRASVVAQRATRLTRWLTELPEHADDCISMRRAELGDPRNGIDAKLANDVWIKEQDLQSAEKSLLEAEAQADWWKRSRSGRSREERRWRQQAAWAREAHRWFDEAARSLRERPGHPNAFMERMVRAVAYQEAHRVRALDREASRQEAIGRGADEFRAPGDIAAPARAATIDAPDIGL
jgi:hypothetical protein